MYIQVNSGFYVLGSAGKAMKFNMMGVRTEDVSYAYYTSQRTSLPCEVVSVVSTMGGFELAFFDKDDNMTRYQAPDFEDGSKLVMAIFSRQNFFKCLKSEGTKDGVSYTQMLFVYRDFCPFNFERLLNLRKVA